MAKSAYHPSEISKRSSDGREVSSLLAKKAAIRQEITKIQLKNAKTFQTNIKFNGELAKLTHHPSEISKRSTGDREAPALLAKKAAIRQEITKIQLRNVKNFQSPIKFNGELAKSTHHPSEISKRSTGSRDAPTLLAKKAAIRKKYPNEAHGIQEMPALPNKKLRHHMMPQF